MTLPVNYVIVQSCLLSFFTKADTVTMYVIYWFSRHCNCIFGGRNEKSTFTAG
ncbi:hypothetical protein HMPREF1547_02421 [Blautia sp. KLE 1732]|nr:hypothetical protein HMPREF1547_02421 [Blautia sp. KLE 1732]